MASKSSCNLLLLAAALASIFAANAAAGNGDCFPGIGFPSDDLLLPSCRDYVAQQICGVFTPGPGSPLAAESASSSPYSPGRPYNAKLRCCQELAGIPRQCRCEALSYFKGLSSPSPRPSASGLMELPGCPWELQGGFVTLLVAPGQCNLVTIDNARYCPAVDQPLMRAAVHHHDASYDYPYD